MLELNLGTFVKDFVPTEGILFTANVNNYGSHIVVFI